MVVAGAAVVLAAVVGGLVVAGAAVVIAAVVGGLVVGGAAVVIAAVIGGLVIGGLDGPGNRRRRRSTCRLFRRAVVEERATGRGRRGGDGTRRDGRSGDHGARRRTLPGPRRAGRAPSVRVADLVWKPITAARPAIVAPTTIGARLTELAPSPQSST